MGNSHWQAISNVRVKISIKIYQKLDNDTVRVEQCIISQDNVVKSVQYLYRCIHDFFGFLLHTRHGKQKSCNPFVQSKVHKTFDSVICPVV